MAKKFFNLVFVIYESYKPSNAYTTKNKFGGETGIRTPEPVAQLLPFQGSAIDHSAISPEMHSTIL